MVMSWRECRTERPGNGLAETGAKVLTKKRKAPSNSGFMATKNNKVFYATI